jgi:hypothetical protein
MLNDVKFLKISKQAAPRSSTPIQRIGSGFKGGLLWNFLRLAMSLSIKERLALWRLPRLFLPLKPLAALGRESIV